MIRRWSQRWGAGVLLALLLAGPAGLAGAWHVAHAGGPVPGAGGGCAISAADPDGTHDPANCLVCRAVSSVRAAVAPLPSLAPPVAGAPPLAPRPFAFVSTPDVSNASGRAPPSRH